MSKQRTERVDMPAGPPDLWQSSCDCGWRGDKWFTATSADNEGRGHGRVHYMFRARADELDPPARQED